MFNVTPLRDNPKWHAPPNSRVNWLEGSKDHWDNESYNWEDTDTGWFHFTCTGICVLGKFPGWDEVKKHAGYGLAPTIDKATPDKKRELLRELYDTIIRSEHIKSSTLSAIRFDILLDAPRKAPQHPGYSKTDEGDPPVWP